MTRTAPSLSLPARLWHGIDFNKPSDVAYALADGCDPNTPDEYGNVPLHVACWRGHVEIVQHLLDAGASLTYATRSDGYLPIHHAAGNSIASLRLLLELGADPGTRGTFYGNTPLHDAAANGRSDAVQLLIAIGADVNARDNVGNTPLHACLPRYPSIAAALIDAGADIATLNQAKDSPLDHFQTDVAQSLRARAALRKPSPVSEITR